MSPTVFREGEFRFYFILSGGKSDACSCQPSRRRSEVLAPPSIELARNIGLPATKLGQAERLVQTRQQEIMDAWNDRFGC